MHPDSGFILHRIRDSNLAETSYGQDKGKIRVPRQVPIYANKAVCRSARYQRRIPDRDLQGNLTKGVMLLPASRPVWASGEGTQHPVHPVDPIHYTTVINQEEAVVGHVRLL
uniref:Uncharacterized protein n=1 Tax=Bionectria ochroleuca TaxID=29856 RepID=A0A0B7K2H9_BIOOC